MTTHSNRADTAPPQTARLEARNLVKDFHLRSGFRTNVLHAVKDVSFTIEAGKTVALVGESGSGKSTIARMLMKLETPTSGEILLDGKPSGARGRALERYRADVQMVFQDPFASLNPFHTIVHHLERPIRLHHPDLSRSQVRERAVELLERVRLTPGESFAERRPHELSGGQRQRVAIARALAPGRGSSSRMSRSRCSTCRSGWAFSTCWLTCSARRTSVCSTSRTTWRRLGTSPTRSWCSTRATWSSAVLRTRSS
ncbi:hypothetical protein GCM10010213_16900 [Microbacterium maritypicum]|uniref:ABC transporter domain-containing protein n=1 Tax=Microbacterium maritypicum TaxID=33918 RepID=A0A4Y4B9S3_MICMQ|nr:hypothetical protein MLI01_17820 [Microbacterium liquefaciens]GGV56414.1 hypothetical protein GCM10010213_16900 [Microbacterium liquefaciens]